MMNCSHCGANMTTDQKFCPQCGKEPPTLQNTNTSALLRRAMLFLESDDWSKADDYCEQVLDLEPENAQAYVIKLMIRNQVKTEADLANAKVSFANWQSYQFAYRFADAELRARLEGYLQQVLDRLKQEEDEAKRLEEKKKQLEIQRRTIQNYNQARRYDRADATISDTKQAIALYSKVLNYQDSRERLEICKKRLTNLEEQRERLLLEQDEAEKRQSNIISIIVFSMFAAMVICIICYCMSY